MTETGSKARKSEKLKAGARNKVVLQAAQDLQDPSFPPPVVRTRLQSELRPFYRVMLVEDPQLAAYRIAQHTNAAFQGAFEHLAGDNLIRTTLPKLRGEESLIPSDLPPEPDSYMGFNIFNPFADPYDTFLRAGVHLVHGAENQLYDAVRENTNHPYHPLFLEMSSVYDDYRERLAIYAPERAGIRDPQERALAGGKDNVQSIMSALIARDMASDTVLTTDEMTRRALGDIDTISWLASVSRHVFADIFRYPAGYFPRQENERLGSDAFTLYAGVFTEVGEHVVFNHGSLKSGPWREPGSCVGKFPIQSFAPSAKANAIELFSLAEQRTGLPVQTPNDGTYIVAKALGVVGVNIGEQTLFEHRSKR